MMQEITSEHRTDGAGNPAGGVTTGRGISITWQDGPLGRGAERKEPNGAFVEGVIGAALNRLEYYQTASGGRFECWENEEAIRHLRAALAFCAYRTADRERREVEGTHVP